MNGFRTSIAALAAGALCVCITPAQAVTIGDLEAGGIFVNGHLTFSDFVFHTSPSNNPPVTLSSIPVTAFTSASGIGFKFDNSYGAGAANQYVSYGWDFKVTADTGYVITGFEEGTTQMGTGFADNPTGSSTFSVSNTVTTTALDVLSTSYMGTFAPQSAVLETWSVLVTTSPDYANQGWTEGGNSYTFTVVPVPEPATLSLAALGLGLMAMRRRRKA
jgi:hypothetical protein